VSIGHRLEEDELSDVTSEDLYSILGAHDTPKLFLQSYKVDCEYDIPFGAGNSIDRKTIYIDRQLYEEVMDNAFAATGLEPQQIIDCWCDHEHVEKSIVDGDNLVDTYYGGHRCALRFEHESVLSILGHRRPNFKLLNYEKVIWPGLVRCYKRTPKKAPKDLWLSPLIDEPEDRDLEHLKVLKSLGLTEADKLSKYKTHYGFRGRPCRDCTMWNPEKMSQEGGRLAFCDAVTGLVRENRHCDEFKPTKKAEK
jgi:hypothetical protein